MSTVSSKTRLQKKERDDIPTQPYGVKNVTIKIGEASSYLIHLSNDYCYYHRMFGKDARHCRTPCNFAKKTTSSKKPEKNDKAWGGI